MKKTKIAMTLAVGALGVVSLASCGNDKLIHFYSSAGDSNAPLLKEVIDNFNAKSGSDWKIELTNPGGGYDGLKQAVSGDIQAGTLPGLTMCYADHVAEYLEAGVVVDMNKFINDPEIGLSQEVKSDFIKGYWDEGWKAFGGTSEADFMYTLPLSKSTEVMFYNKTALDMMNIDYSDINNWTWDKFWDVCNQIKNDKTFKKWTPMGYDSESNFMITLAEQYGYAYTSATGDHYLFNNEDNLKMLTDLKAKFDKNLFTLQEIYGTFTSNLFTAKRDAETQVKLTGEDGTVKDVLSCVFSIGSTAGASHQVPKGNLFEVGLARLPQADPKNPKSINQGPSLVMFDQGTGEEAEEKERVTWLFIKELMDTNFQAAYSKNSGYVPVRLSVQDNADYKAWLDIEDNVIAETVKFCLANSDAYFVSPAFNGSNKARTEFGSALLDVLNGKSSPKQALEAAQKNCEF